MATTVSKQTSAWPTFAGAKYIETRYVHSTLRPNAWDVEAANRITHRARGPGVQEAAYRIAHRQNAAGAGALAPLSTVCRSSFRGPKRLVIILVFIF